MASDATEPTSVFVGIGSNMENPRVQVQRAVRALGGIRETQVSAVSSLYLSAPFGPVEQPDFVNAVARLTSFLDPRQIFGHLQAIEKSLGRVRNERWGPRVIDLDLLVHGMTVMHEDDLTVPHPGIAERNFVLLPLQELAPDLEIPGLGRVADLAVDENEPRISRLD
ncbi:MAG: 2-amino-4-hydroxy-6-hydroxymethyldihydropteridine diphosphokinase [Woeseiaceae bacterium]|nr:2-amino-4-hydroxy-6-hydroxymethyldihydropteridine diphosphokinase [Woeseiaceae bacterium]NIP20058.1 2-amino-4-hydroxy-6-hydroxymethyldihydropteridine diphosphokinase [Woeseiaceae bacterium]NIS88854.1 2-amino-4-hydroxy-6-hydroxymethyldihydropteridine diphosphokinase [Woeseiaceae bacterium]